MNESKKTPDTPSETEIANKMRIKGRTGDLLPPITEESTGKEIADRVQL